MQRLHALPIGPKWGKTPAPIGADYIAWARPQHLLHEREAERRFWEAWDCANGDPRGGQCKPQPAQASAPSV